MPEIASYSRWTHSTIDEFTSYELKGRIRRKIDLREGPARQRKSFAVGSRGETQLRPATLNTA